MDEIQDVFEIMRTTRPMRRLKPDPVPQVLIERALDAGTWAPNSMNTQPYHFVVVREEATRTLFGKRYGDAMATNFARHVPPPEDTSPRARNIRTALETAQTLADVPVLILVCGKRDWPFAVAESDRVGTAPPSYGSVYPAVQNVLLALRALGLGSYLTTMHQLFEAELAAQIGLPDDHGIVAVLPVGWPLGRFGPVGRRPSRELTFLERWGKQPAGSTGAG